MERNDRSLLFGASDTAAQSPTGTNRRALLVLLAGVLVGAALLPIDHWAMTTLGPYGGIAANLGGDLARELEFLQQFGAISSLVIIFIVIIRLDPARSIRLWDFGLAMGLTALVCNAIKMLTGRPRPRVIFHEHALEGYTGAVQFPMFWNAFPLPRTVDGQATHLWAHSYEVWRGISSDLWAMPSSHTAAAACAAVALARLYPRLTGLVMVLMGITACARVLLGAHYPSDVAVGLAVGWAVGMVVMDGRWLSRRRR